MTNLKNKIKIIHIMQALSLLFILFLIFFSQYSKKVEIKLDINPENINLEEQKSYPEDAPADLVDVEDEAIADNQSMEENQNDENSDADTPTDENIAEETAKKEIPRDDLMIGIIADAHSGQEYGFARLSAATWSLKNYFAPDVVIDLGDLIESRFHYESIKKNAAMADFKSASYYISRYFPVYHAIGNHEVLSLSKADIQNLTGRKNYYAINKKGYNIIILDSNYNKNETSVDAKHADNFIYDGALPENELGWLKKQVENNNNNIIFIHHPLSELTNRSEIEGIINKNKKRIILIANGHRHPKVLGVSAFGGVKSYEISSAQFQKAYAIIRINGVRATVISRKFMN